MNIFSNKQVYGESWEVSNVRNFTEEEIKAVSKAEVVPSSYGSSVCFHMISGGRTYIPMSNDSKAAVGDTIDLSKAEIITLERQGDGAIDRIRA